MRKRKGFSYHFLRILTAILGLAIGFSIFTWQALGKAEIVDLEALESKESSKLDEYINFEANNDRSQEDSINLQVDADYPIKYVKQKAPDVENILVVGSDARGGEIARSDTMIIVTINKKDNSIKLTSVLRDTQMQLNDLNGNASKVNASYAYGGIGMLINTLNANLDLDIQRFFVFDFTSSIHFVDKLAGVNIKVADKEVLPTNDVIRGTCHQYGLDPDDYYLHSAGEQTLNGIQAISWARVRKIDSDFYRTSRQRVLIKNIMTKFMHKNPIAKADFAFAVIDELITNCSRSKMISLGFKVLPRLDNIQDYYVPQEGMYETNYSNWNLVFNREQQIPALHAFIWNEDESE